MNKTRGNKTKGFFIILLVLLAAVFARVVMAEDHDDDDGDDDHDWNLRHDFDDDHEYETHEDEHEDYVYQDNQIVQETVVEQTVTPDPLLEEPSMINTSEQDINMSAYADDDQDGVLNKDDQHPGENDLLFSDSDNDKVVDLYDQYPGLDDAYMNKQAEPVAVQDTQAQQAAGNWWNGFLHWLGII